MGDRHTGGGQSHAQPKPGGQSHKGGDSEFGTLRAWVGTAHSSGGGDAHTDFKLEDLADFVQQLLPLMLLIRDEAIRGKSWFSRFSANSPSIFAKPTDYDT